MFITSCSTLSINSFLCGKSSGQSSTLSVLSAVEYSLISDISTFDNSSNFDITGSNFFRNSSCHDWSRFIFASFCKCKSSSFVKLFILYYCTTKVIFHLTEGLSV